MNNPEALSLQRRTLLTGFAALGTSAAIGSDQVIAAVEQNTVKRRGIGLLASDPGHASP
jgi:hypothetical protein